tara:strand:+ start:2787 stop:3740 length:954 start_codon:yes stop_codon:yes gene_type:complete
MSSEITTAFVKQFSANVFHLSQQKGSRLGAFVRNESQRGKSAFYDRIGSVTAVKRTSRHADTPQIDTPHSRRRVTLTDYEWADLVDDADKIRMLIDPTSAYAQAAVWALARAKDDLIIEAATGSAYGGEDGSSTVALAAANKVAAFDGSATAGNNLNLQTLRKVKEKFDANDVDESIPRYIAIGSSQLQALLGETSITSADFNTVKALVQGEIDTFLGFKFIRTERLSTDYGSSNISYNNADGTYGTGSQALTPGSATYRKCFAWAQDGLLLATAKEVQGKISERADKSYSTQVYACMGMGATRMEENKVVEIACKE